MRKLFTHCIHCIRDLGRNESLETFQVGTRLAFDGAKGRLWVVCAHCGRWNLSPLEERWEAIEDAERQFRDSRLRVATDQIGFAKLRSGLELVRIGAPQRPEMAAWRYGDQFGKRRKRQMLITGAVTGSAAAILGGVAFVGVSMASFAGIYANAGIWDALINGRGSTVVARIFDANGDLLTVKRSHARMSTLEHTSRDAPMRLRLEHANGQTILTGSDAQRAAQQILPTVNRFGGSKKSVQMAVRQLEEIGDPARVASYIQNRLGAVPSAKRWKRSKSRWGSDGMVSKLPGALHNLPVHDRLALEMALHEESERRAMDGELAELERAWRDAEVVANIADNMFTPADVQATLERLSTNKKP